MPRKKIDAAFKRVSDNRVGIPKGIRDGLPWIAGKEPIAVFLLMMRGPDRYRVVRDSDIKTDPHLVEIYEQINNSGGEGERRASDFDDDVSAVAGLEFRDTWLKPGPPEWRLDLPRITIDLLNVRPPHEEVVVVINDEFLEVWSVDRFRAVFNRR